MKCLNWIQNLIKLCVRLYVKIWFCIHIHIVLKIHTAAIYIEYKLAECHALFMKTTDNNYYLHTICSNIPRADIRICECFTCLHVSVVKKKVHQKVQRVLIDWSETQWSRFTQSAILFTAALPLLHLQLQQYRSCIAFPCTLHPFIIISILIPLIHLQPHLTLTSQHLSLYLYISLQ